MALNIPLPKVVADVGPGGGIVTAMRGMNALTQENMQNRLLGLKGQAAELENKYLPLETAIKAQNALSYGGRLGNTGMYLRAISEMPAAERQVYLANPDNRKNYLNMLEQFRTGVNSPGVANVLTPEYIKSFGIGSNIPPQNVLNQLQGQPQPQEMPNPIDNQTQISVPSQGMSPQSMPQMPSEERDLINAQHRINHQTSGKVQSARAEGAATMDKFLMENREKISKALNDAIKYQGIYGRGKKWLDILKKDQPEAYANYQFVKGSLIPNLSNQIKFMEHMGATNTQLEHAGNMVAALDKLDSNPETSRRTINKSIDSLMDLSKSIYQVAEPSYPGTYKKLFNLSELKGDYIPENKTENKSSDKSIKNKVGLKDNIELPQFEGTTPEEGRRKFKEWFRQQPLFTQNLVRRQLEKEARMK